MLYIIAGEDSQTAKDIQFWSIAQFYALQAAQMRIISERIKEREKGANKG
jgi:hypothetical protein